jgi:hypothetical protein
MPADLSHRPNLLFEASGERLAAARHAAQASDWVMAVYLGGLAIECLLQAFALRTGAAHEPHHDLAAWLARCPSGLQDDVIRKARSEWNTMVAVWRNNLRFQSSAAFLGYLRRLERFWRVRGGGQATMKHAARVLIDGAERVHAIGVAQWRR